MTPHASDKETPPTEKQGGETEDGKTDGKSGESGDAKTSKPIVTEPDNSKNEGTEENPEAKKQKEQAELDEKKKAANEKVSNSASLLQSDKDNFKKEINEVTSYDQLGKIDEILKKVSQKEEERKTKLTPVSISKYLGGEANDRYYIAFTFKTSKETYEKLKTKKLKLGIEVKTKDEAVFEANPDPAATFQANNSNIIQEGTLNDLVIVRVETLSYFNRDQGSKEGNYKLANL